MDVSAGAAGTTGAHDGDVAAVQVGAQGGTRHVAAGPTAHREIGGVDQPSAACALGCIGFYPRGVANAHMRTRCFNLPTMATGQATPCTQAAIDMQLTVGVF